MHLCAFPFIHWPMFLPSLISPIGSPFFKAFTVTQSDFLLRFPLGTMPIIWPSSYNRHRPIACAKLKDSMEGGWNCLQVE